MIYRNIKYFGKIGERMPFVVEGGWEWGISQGRKEKTWGADVMREESKAEAKTW